MIEHAIQHNPDAFAVQLIANLLKVLIRAQTAVDFTIVSCIVPMGIRFKDGEK